MSDSPTKDKTLADAVYEELQAAIVSGNLAPGARLKEPEMSRRFGISRGPLREAFRRLEARRLVTLAPRSGARVTSLSIRQLLDIYQVREALEGMACRLASQNMTQLEIVDLGRLLDRHSQTIEQQQGREYFFQENDLDFHYRIARGSGNAILAQILCEDLYHLMRMYRYKFSRTHGRPLKALKEHRRIIEAIAEHDGELAELLMRRHIRSARKHIQSTADSATHSDRRETL